MYLYNASLTNNWWTGFLGFHSHRSIGYVKFTVPPERVERSNKCLQNIESLYNTSNSIVKNNKRAEKIYYKSMKWDFRLTTSFITFLSSELTIVHNVRHTDIKFPIALRHTPLWFFIIIIIIIVIIIIIKTVWYTISKTKTDKTLFLLRVYCSKWTESHSQSRSRCFHV
jgi:hypothetical protein